MAIASVRVVNVEVPSRVGDALRTSATAPPTVDPTVLDGAVPLGRSLLSRSRSRSRVPIAAMLDVQEAERRRIARDLHDVVGQALTAVKLSLQAVERRTTDPDTTARLAASIGIVDQALAQVRGLAIALRPSVLDDIGLAAAIRALLVDRAGDCGWDVSFVGRRLAFPIDPAVESACFRIAQEALTNIARHAGATRVAVSLVRSDREIELRIDDDGQAFDVSAAMARARAGASLGLIGMSERARLIGGSMFIASGPGGTSVRVCLPLESAHQPGVGSVR